MLTELQTKKWTRLFHIYDADGNGVVEKADFEQIAQNAAASRKFTPGTPEYDKIHAKFMSDWERLRKDADQNNDGKVELAEWLKHGERRSNSPEREEIVVDEANFIFKELDRNGDGVISLEEYKRFYRALRLSDELAAEIFRKLDLNGDEEISKDEFVELMRQFHSDKDDPDAPGNLIFGPLET